VLSPPAGLRPDLLTDALASGWGVEVASLEYLALGFGSHHWKVTDAGGGRWFATLDDLGTKRLARDEPLDAVFGRLAASLATAVALADVGLPFVVAPIRSQARDPARRLTDRLSLALYPYVDGQNFAWGEFSSGHRRALLDLVVSIHTAPAAARSQAMTDDLSVTRRDDLEAALEHAWTDAAASGPYGSRAAELVNACKGPIRQLLTRYDTLADRVRSHGDGLVLTHGEPHPGNTMLSQQGWLMIDWDTVLVAPQERDLWDLDPGDGSILAAYQRATGTVPRPDALELFRLRWDLTDIALYVGQFRAPHLGDANDDKAFAGLAATLGRISG